MISRKCLVDREAFADLGDIFRLGELAPNACADTDVVAEAIASARSIRTGKPARLRQKKGAGAADNASPDDHNVRRLWQFVRRGALYRFLSWMLI